MDIKKKVVITLTEEDIIKLIQERCEKEGYIVNNVTTHIKNKKWTEGGGGMAEMDYEKLIFEGISVECEEKQ